MTNAHVSLQDFRHRLRRHLLGGIPGGPDGGGAPWLDGLVMEYLPSGNVLRITFPHIYFARWFAPHKTDFSAAVKAAWPDADAPRLEYVLRGYMVYYLQMVFLEVYEDYSFVKKLACGIMHVHMLELLLALYYEKKMTAAGRAVSYVSVLGTAKELIDGYFKTYPHVKEYMNQSISKARECGYTETLFGRRCQLPDINSHNAVVRGYAERNAINSPIQGSAADIMKIAMINIDRRMQREDIQSRMILQVHDELNFSVLPDEKEHLERLVIEEMQNAAHLSVPLIADSGWGSNWLEAH